MLDFNDYPKSIKKAVRFIKQDAPIEQFEELKILIEYALVKRERSLNKDILKWIQE